MFGLSIKKDELLEPLLTVAGAVDKKQSVAILSHFLFKLYDNRLQITATDLELEISTTVNCQSEQPEGQMTVPAKKFIDIIRSLDSDGADPVLKFENDILTIKQGRSSFKLSSLPASHYPVSDDECNEFELPLPRQLLLDLLHSTHFAMAQQDVRLFLNGLLLEFEGQTLSAVATDGHRMAIHRHVGDHAPVHQRLLLPRKAVQELVRLLNAIDDEMIVLAAGKGHLRVTTTQYSFLSKLIDSRFPFYAKAIPRENDKFITVSATALKRSLSRIMILAHEKSRGVLLHLQDSLITLIANNQEQEEAVESLEALTEGDELKIGLNAGYFLDVLNYFTEGDIRLSLSSTENSILIEALDNEQYQYILMPMKI